MVDEPGHVFVVHADLTQLACDEVLLPTDEFLDVGWHWSRLGPFPTAAPVGWRSQRRRVSDSWQVDGRSVRLVNTGTVPELAATDWLAEGVRQGLRAAGNSLNGRGAGRFKRARPLVGMPIFGVGAGGFDHIRGQVLDALLREAEEATQESGFDVALVCWKRADYAAVQSRRGGSGSWAAALDPDLIAGADRLGHMAASGELALFLGAGVSAGAGLPTWKELISRLAEDAPTYQNRTEELEDLDPTFAAALLQDALGEDTYRNVLKGALKRDEHALSHGLLASLKVDQAVTTNFDDLYEKASRVPFGPEVLRVVPWQRVVPGKPWLMKMHGDVERGSVVLSLDDFLRYDAQSRPLASIVQTLLMTRHVLFVGYSLTDDNFVRLARDVRRLLREVGKDSMVGTVLSLFPKMTSELWKGDVHYVYLDRGARQQEAIAPAARRLEIFLDRLAYRAAAEETSYLLDDRYQELVGDADADVIDNLRALAPAVKRGDTRRWAALSRTLSGYGVSDH